MQPVFTMLAICHVQYSVHALIELRLDILLFVSCTAARLDLILITALHFEHCTEKHLKVWGKGSQNFTENEISLTYGHQRKICSRILQIIARDMIYAHKIVAGKDHVSALDKAIKACSQIIKWINFKVTQGHRQAFY